MNSKWNVLVIDDEPPARRTLTRLLEDYTETLQLAGEANSGATAIQLINEQKPDLLFLDIQLNDMTGFEVLRHITCQPSVIFTTAYEEYAIKAFDELAIDYLLKPIREERFKQSIQKLTRLQGAGQPFDLAQLISLLETVPQKKKWTAFPVKLGEKIILIPFDAVSYFEANDKYVSIYTTDGNKYLTELPLHQLTEKLPSHFLRIQKSYIINKQKIKELNKHFNGRFIFIMNDKSFSKLTSGLTYYDLIRAELGF